MPDMHATYTSALTGICIKLINFSIIIYSRMYLDVLLCVSRLIPPDQLIALIPNEDFFSKFVEMSEQSVHLKQLKEAIVARSFLLKTQ